MALQYIHHKNGVTNNKYDELLLTEKNGYVKVSSKIMNFNKPNKNHRRFNKDLINLQLDVAHKTLLKNTNK